MWHFPKPLIALSNTAVFMSFAPKFYDSIKGDAVYAFDADISLCEEYEDQITQFRTPTLPPRLPISGSREGEVTTYTLVNTPYRVMLLPRYPDLEVPNDENPGLDDSAKENTIPNFSMPLHLQLVASSANSNDDFSANLTPRSQTPSSRRRPNSSAAKYTRDLRLLTPRTPLRRLSPSEIGLVTPGYAKKQWVCCCQFHFFPLSTLYVSLRLYEL